MSINDALPPDAERLARGLLDDDLFVDAIWNAMVFYHDLRQFGMQQSFDPKKKAFSPIESKDLARKYRRLHTAATQYRAALKDLRLDVPQSLLLTLDRDIAEARSYEDAVNSRAAVRRVGGYDGPLRTYMEALDQIFTHYGIARRKLASFACESIRHCTPAGKVPPSFSAISKIRTELNKTRK